MRIVGGKHRGRQLLAPPGRELRPTSDRVRESVFNILTQGGEALGGHNWVQGALVIDGFAGTGAMGLEAVSRGAAHATLLDNQNVALGCCRDNIESLNEEENIDVYYADCLKLKTAPQPCSLIFLDPPYGLGLTVPALESLVSTGWVADKAIAVLEVDRTEEIQPPPAFSILDERQYGKAKILFLGNSQ
ncbi:MAG: 16S rRNA (guanine(966)-N(2))-methyltransferase RsmD [Alphaproteobacteria bacterium]